jgi:hypothetical protein
MRPLESGGVAVGAKVPHAAALEFGTRRMAARPWLRPAVERVRGRLIQLVKEVWPHASA